MARSSSILPARPRRATREPMPDRIAPMLATLGEIPPDGQNWAFEYKWDGIRATSFWDGRRLTILSRNQLDITRRYPELADLGEALGRKRAILDGEIVALDEAGRPSFPRLQRRMHAEGAEQIRRLASQIPAWYVVFDVLWAGGRSTMSLPYRERRKVLERLTVAGAAWQITPAHVGQGREMLQAARRNGLEGVIAKRLDSPYEPGRRSPSWLKIKVIFGQEFVVGGWVPEQGNPDRVGSLLLGYYDCPSGKRPPKLHYAGSVGTGYTAEIHADLTRKLKQRHTDANPFGEAVPKKSVLFVKPDLVAEVEYRRWPEGALIHQAAFKGLRTDKSSREVVKEGQGRRFSHGGEK